MYVETPMSNSSRHYNMIFAPPRQRMDIFFISDRPYLSSLSPLYLISCHRRFQRQKQIIQTMETTSFDTTNNSVEGGEQKGDRPGSDHPSKPSKQNAAKLFTDSVDLELVDEDSDEEITLTEIVRIEFVYSTDCTDVGDHDNSKKNTKWGYNPFRDWRVYAVTLFLLTGVAIVAISSAQKKSASADAAENTNFIAPDASATDEFPVDFTFDVENYEGDTSISTNIDGDTSLEDEKKDAESHADVEQSQMQEPELDGTAATSKTTKAIETITPGEDATNTPPSYTTTVTSFPSPITISFSMMLTTADFASNVKDPNFGENLIESTIEFLQHKIYAFSSNIAGMSMRGLYSWECISETCPSDSVVVVTFSGLARLKKGTPAKESSILDNMIQTTFSHSSILNLWADDIASYGIDITSAKVQQDGDVIGSYTHDGFIPPQQTPSSPTEVMRAPISSWAEGFQRIGPKGGTTLLALFVIEPISMQLVTEAEDSIIDAKKLIDITFSHFWGALSGDIPSFVGLRLRVDTYSDQQRTTTRRENLRALEGSTGTRNTVFTARIITSGESHTRLKDIRDILHSSLTGAELEQWMAAAVENNIDVVAARVVE